MENIEETADGKLRVKYRISIIYAVCIMIVASFFDLVKLILDILLVGVIGTFISSTLGWAIIWGLFYMKGISFTKNPKNAIAASLGIVFGYVPILSALPEFILASLRIIVISRVEDKQNFEINKAKYLAEKKTKEEQLAKEQAQREAEYLELAQEEENQRQIDDMELVGNA